MQFAMDKRLGKEVTANTAIKGRNYNCPTCGEPVFVRGGTIRIWHFAHRSGRADPNCENYHPGLAIGNPLTLQSESSGGEVGDQRPRIVPLVLSLRVEALSDVARGGGRQWRLVLTVPKSLTGVGRVRVPTGFGSISKKLELSSLIRNSQDIEVSPNALRFGAEWVSDEVDHDYREVVSERLDGLTGEYAQAFTASATKAKPQTSNLVWGDSYYLIWKRVDFVIPDVLNALAMVQFEGWFAALVTLPPLPSKEVADWLEASLRVRIQEGRRQWGILYPPPIEIDFDGNVLVSDSNCLVLGFIDAGDGSIEPSKLSIATIATPHQVSVEIRKKKILQIMRDAIDVRGPISLQWDSRPLPSIISALAPDTELPLPASMMRFRETKVDGEKAYPLHSPEARHALDRIRQGEAELISLSTPRGVTGTLEQRLKDGQWQHGPTLSPVSDVVQRGNSWFLSALQLSTIVSALAEVDSDVRLSFGIFGQYVALARIRDRAVRTCLLSDTRRRIIWYCRANDSCNRSKRPLDLSSDSELLEVFDRAFPRPHLAAYRTFLQKRLQKSEKPRRAS